jgi:hypothetical protein
MNADQARLIRLYTAETGGTVEDDTPNAPPVPPNPPATTFALRLEGEAGALVGASNTQYTLSIVAYDVTVGDNEPALNPPAADIPDRQRFDAGQPSPRWVASGTDFITQQTATINVPAALKGHTFRYTASLVSDDFQNVSFIQSDPFVLV